MIESRSFYLWILGGFLAIMLVGGVFTCQRGTSPRKYPEECVLAQVNEEIVIEKVIDVRRSRKW